MFIRRFARNAVAALGLSTLVLASALAPTALAGGATQIRGLLEPDIAAACPASVGALGAYVASGSLEGCWYVDTAEFKNESQNGFLAVGTEHFTGCLNGSTCGTFFTTYSFTAKIVDGVEVHGRCNHPISGGTGGFAGVSGVIHMHDLPNGCAIYNGEVRF
jgi:hypothetical protein